MSKTYVKVLDDLEDHPRWLGVSPASVGLWVLALGYCGRHLTDGVFPSALLRRWGVSVEDQAVGDLLAHDRWHGSGHDCGDCPEVLPGQLYVHAYLDHQRSSEQVAELSAKRAEAGRKGGSVRSSNQVAKQPASRGEQPEAKGTPTTDTDTKNNTRSREASAIAAEFETWWEMYPNKVGKLAAGKAYAKARKSTDADTLVAGLANASAVWTAERRERQFVPHPATWLNQGRWSDELPALPGMPDSKPATLMQCQYDDPHPRHETEDETRRYVCMGVEA